MKWREPPLDEPDYCPRHHERFIGPQCPACAEDEQRYWEEIDEERERDDMYVDGSGLL